jgi:hypothetical protein
MNASLASRNNLDSLFTRGIAVGKIGAGLVFIISIVFVDVKMIMRHVCYNVDD